MTGSADLAEPARRWPSVGRLVAAVGAAVALASMFLPWYSVSLRIRSYADLSTFAMMHAGGASLACDPPDGHGCRVSAQVGALTGGIWDWRTLIAVGPAAVLMLVVASAMRSARASASQPATGYEGPPPAARPADWRVLAGIAAATVAVVTAAILVSPVSQPGGAGPPLDLSSSASYGAITGLSGALIALAGALLTAPWVRRTGRAGATAAAPTVART